MPAFGRGVPVPVGNAGLDVIRRTQPSWCQRTTGRCTAQGDISYALLCGKIA
jgi:hypothetical protein